MCLFRSRFHLSFDGLCSKTLRISKKLVKVSLLSLLKDSLVNFLGQDVKNRIKSILVFLIVIGVKIFKH